MTPKTDGWAYNRQNNAIEFFGSHSLSDGDAVRISLGASSNFCSLKGFDLDKLNELKVVIGNKVIPRDATGTKGWDYNQGSNCIELYGEHNLTPGLFVEISWGGNLKILPGEVFGTRASWRRLLSRLTTWWLKKAAREWAGTMMRKPIASAFLVIGCREANQK